MRESYSIQRFRGGWAIVWRDDAGKRHRAQLAATDRAAAEAEAARRWAIGSGTAWTVGRCVEGYFADRALAGTVTLPRLKLAWAQARPTFEALDPSEVNDTLARRYAQRRGRAPATIRKELGTVVSALRWAARQRHIPPFPGLWMPPLAPRREKHISFDEVRALIEAARAPHVRLYLEIAIATAARPAAILDLTWPQIDFAARLIRFNPDGRVQTAKRRPVIPMTNRLHHLLAEAYKLRACNHVIEHGGEPIKSIKKGIAAAATRAGIHATPYTIRHSAAVIMANQGVPMSEIASYLGHTDSRTTEREYAKYLPTYLRKAASALDW